MQINSNWKVFFIFRNHLQTNVPSDNFDNLEKINKKKKIKI